MQNQRYCDQQNEQRLFQNNIALEGKNYDQGEQQPQGRDTVKLWEKPFIEILYAFFLYHQKARKCAANQRNDNE